ncbi:ribonuclease H-like domain-containing protein [Tanacetum coccineum]
MKLTLQARNKFSFVDGSFVKSAYVTSDVLSTQRDKCNADVLTWIMNFVSSDVYMDLVYFVDADYVWKELESTYDKINGFFLMGLDDFYQSVRSVLSTRDPLPKVKDAYTTISREESHRGIPESSSVTESKLNATSFVAKSFNNTRGSLNGNLNRGPNPNLMCINYGMIGYTIERWYELITNDKQQFATCQNSSSFTADQMKKLLSLINEIPSGSIHANITDLKREITVRTGNESGGLYLFDLDSDSPTGSSSTPTHRLINDPIDSLQTKPRMTSRVSKICAKLNDYVIDTKLRYGLEKHVNYAKLKPTGLAHLATKGNLEEVFSERSQSVEPSTYYEAALNPKWIEAMNDEIVALYRNNTWIVTDLPKDRKAIGCKWIYKITYKASDVNNAFLYGDLIEDVYMSMPMGFDDNDCNKVETHKSITWFEIRSKAVNANLTAALIEHCFFTRKSIFGFVVMIGKFPVSWKSKKQLTIFWSSTEAEYKCLAASTREVIWICNTLNEFKITGLFPVEIFCDINIQIAK